MPKIIDISRTREPFEYGMVVRGVTVPIVSPYAESPYCDPCGATGLRGLAARAWLRVRFLAGLSEAEVLRVKIRRAWPKSHHSLLKNLATVELIEISSAIDQVAQDWAASIRSGVAEQLAAQRARRDEAGKTNAPSPGAGVVPGSASPGMTPIVPGGTLHGHPVGRARTAEHGTLTF